MERNVEVGVWSWRTWTLVFGGYWLYWLVVAWPGVAQPWLYLDDYNAYDPVFTPGNTWLAGIPHGRPMLGLYFQLFFFDRPPDWNGFNRVMTAWQYAVHAFAGAIMARVLSRWLGLTGGVLGAALFVCWPGHFEAVLWYAASLYPYGAVWAMGSLFFLERWLDTGRRRELAAGLGFLVIALYSQQNSGLMGLALWPLLLLFRWQGEGLKWGRTLVGVASAGLVAALTAGSSMAMLLSGSRSDRIEATTWADRLNFFWLQLEKYTVFPHIYTPPVRGLHAALLGIFLVIAAWAFYRRRFEPGWWLAFLLTLPAAAFAVTAANILSGSLFPSYRILYGLPLLGTMVLAIGWLTAASLRPLRMALGLVTGTLVLAYSPLLREGSAEIVELYNRDIGTVEALQAYADERGATKALFMTWQYGQPWHPNPYGLDMFIFGSLKSVLHEPSSIYRIMGIYTDLDHIDWTRYDELLSRYGPIAAELPRDQPYLFHHDPEEDLVVVFPR